MRIYLVRHSIPEDDDDDPDPGLTKGGVKLVERLAEWMVAKDEVPNAIYASPKMRTQETAEILKDALGLPEVKTDPSIGPSMSIRGLVTQVAQDKAMTRVMIVSHHETMEHGLRVLNLEPWIHFDIFAMGELRIMKVDRKDGQWNEHRRVMPSDLGGDDNY